MTDIRPEILQGRWIHSHEEDVNTQMVFRPASYAFPPSRGRRGFELKSDQSLIDIGIAASDGPQVTKGTWKLDGSSLQFFKSAGRTPTQTLQVVSADKDRLVVSAK
jgi:hypothetical protein